MPNQDNIITLIGKNVKKKAPVTEPIQPVIAQTVIPLSIYLPLNHVYPPFVIPSAVNKTQPHRQLVSITTDTENAKQQNPVSINNSTATSHTPVEIVQNIRPAKVVPNPKQAATKTLVTIDLTNDTPTETKATALQKPEIQTKRVIPRRRRKVKEKKQRTLQEKLEIAKNRYCNKREFLWIRNADKVFNLNPQNTNGKPVATQNLPSSTQNLPSTTQNLSSTAQNLPLTHQLPPTTQNLAPDAQRVLTNVQISPPKQNKNNHLRKSVPHIASKMSNKKQKQLSLPKKFPSGIPRSFLIGSNTPGAVQHPAPRIPLEYPSGIPRSFLQGANTYSTIPALAAGIQQGAVSAAVPQTESKFISSFQEELVPQRYSPTAAYDDKTGELDEEAKSDSSDSNQGQKRLSAFQRLGPLSEPKKPKLTIKLFNKEQSVREVMDGAESQDDKSIPVHLRKYMSESRDDLVARYLPMWPWKKSINPRKAVTVRESKSAMLLELEQIEDIYDKSNMYIQISVKGYPPNWTKENVLDSILDALKGKSFIPCFVESLPDECKFLVIRARPALLMIHKMGFVIKIDEGELIIAISQVDFSLNHIDFIPRLALRKILAQGYDGECRLNLSAFTLKPDQSHLIYFPLNRTANQMELMQIQSTIVWDYVTELDLSRNRITSIDGFNLSRMTPRLKKLDLSNNCLEKVTALLRCKEIPLKSLRLEGNPLCHYYIEPEKYVYAVKLMFPELTEIDGIPIQFKGDFPPPKKNYCPEESLPVVERFLEIFFPLLDSPIDDRTLMAKLYDANAVLTITFEPSLRYNATFRYVRSLMTRGRIFSEGDMESINGPEAIVKVFTKWPKFTHDPTTFCVDVMNHTDNTTIFRVSGIIKITADSLADDEHLISFMRTVVLYTKHGKEYKIKNEMLYWGTPTSECSNAAFQITTMPLRRPTLSFEKNPDNELKEGLVKIFMSITEMESKPCERCLELKDWNMKAALLHYMKLVRLDSLDSLICDSKSENSSTN